jgi:hypothetical protein
VDLLVVLEAVGRHPSSVIVEGNETHQRVIADSLVVLEAVVRRRRRERNTPTSHDDSLAVVLAMLR